MVTDSGPVYTLTAGRDRVLPAYMNNQPLLLGVSRAEPLACVKPNTRASLEVMGMDGEPVGKFDLTGGYVHIMSQVGYHFPVAIEDIAAPDTPSRLLPFRMGSPVELTTQRPIASALYGFWAINQQQPGLQVYEFWRQEPAFVYGRVPADANPDEWIQTDTGRWRLVPGSYLVGELNCLSGRVVPHTYMVREFAGLAKIGGRTVEEFELPRFD